MHELTFAEELVRAALAAARQNAPGRRVTALEVEVGEFSTVLPELLSGAFAIAAQGTALAGAALRIRQVPLAFACRACGRRFGAGLTACPACGASDVEITAGRHVNLLAIEVQDGPGEEPR